MKSKSQLQIIIWTKLHINLLAGSKYRKVPKHGQITMIKLT